MWPRGFQSHGYRTSPPDQKNSEGLQRGGVNVELHVSRLKLFVDGSPIGRLRTWQGRVFEATCLKHAQPCRCTMHYIGSTLDMEVLEAEAIKWLLAGRARGRLSHVEIAKEVRDRWTVRGRREGTGRLLQCRGLAAAGG